MKPPTSADRVFARPIARMAVLIALCAALLACAGRSALPSRPAAGARILPEGAPPALAASAPSDRTLTVTARIEIESSGDRRPLKAALMMKKPASLRLESVPLLGPPDFFLSIDAGELRVFSPGDGGSFYMGKATARNLSRFFPLAVPAADIVPLLMGQPPEVEASSTCLGEWEAGLYRLDLCAEGEKKIALWIDPVGGLLLRVRGFTEAGDTAYTAEFSDHTQVETYFLPRRLTIKSGAVELTLRYAEMRLDNDAEPFALPIPEGVVPISLDE